MFDNVTASLLLEALKYDNDADTEESGIMTLVKGGGGSVGQGLCLCFEITQ